MSEPLSRAIAQGYQPTMSKRDLRILAAIAAYWIDHGYGPSTRDVAAAAGHPSGSTVHYAFFKLREVGLVDFTEGCSRTVRPTTRGWTTSTLKSPCCVETVDKV